MVRAPYFDKDGLKKGAWTREEDEKLRAYITRYGAWNWRKLPKFAGLSRCGKSCRLRWMNYLRPHLKHGNYSKEEEDLIIKLHEELGNKWSEIAAKLPGRTDNEVKNHWHTRLKKRISEQDQNKSDDEMNEQSNGEAASQADVSQREVMEVEAQSGLAASCEETSQDGFHLFISDTAADQQVMESAVNKWNGEGCSNMASFGECSDDFWTAPFVPDNSFYNQDYYPSFSQEGCLVLSYDSYLDESLDLFYQVMKDFQGSNGS